MTISGFLVQDFPAIGIVGLNTENLTVTHSVAVNDAYYGITNFDGTGGRFLYNTATGAQEAGFYIGDNQTTQFLESGNLAYGNAIGAFIRNASHGTMSNKTWHDNCVGLLMLAGAPGPVTDWTMTGNQSYHNDMVCQLGSRPDSALSRVHRVQSPPITGSGILLAGASNNLIEHNTIWGNHPRAEVARLRRDRAAHGRRQEPARRQHDQGQRGLQQPEVRHQGRPQGDRHQHVHPQPVQEIQPEGAVLRVAEAH